MDKFNKEDKISFTELSGILQRNLDSLKASMEKLWGSKYDNEKSREDMSFSKFEEEQKDAMDKFKDTVDDTIDNLKEYTEYIAKTTTPTGAIIPFAGSVAQLQEILNTGEYVICDGTKGTPNLIGRYIRGGGLGDLGTYIPAGLPNIWGEFTQAAQHGSRWAKGAFYGLPYQGGIASHKSDTRQQCGFDASRCSAIYGRSNTVTPETYVIVWLMRVVKLSDDKINISILQTKGQIIRVNYNSTDYIESFVAVKNKQISISLSAMENYIAGKIIIDGVEYTGSTTELIVTKDTIITASASSKINVNVEIIQSNHQTITVTCNGVDHKDSFITPNGSSFTVSIVGDNGYTPGTLNITKGTLVDDISIFATSATINQEIKNRKITLLCDTDRHESVGLVLNNSEIYYSGYNRGDSTEVDVKDGDTYFGFIFSRVVPHNTISPSIVNSVVQLYAYDSSGAVISGGISGTVSQDITLKTFDMSLS